MYCLQGLSLAVLGSAGHLNQNFLTDTQNLKQRMISPSPPHPQLNNIDPELKRQFNMCGISEAQLKDEETSKVMDEFIEKKGGVEAVKNELRRQGERAAW